jgi:hypothetical protein
MVQAVHRSRLNIRDVAIFPDEIAVSVEIESFALLQARFGKVFPSPGSGL